MLLKKDELYKVYHGDTIPHMFQDMPDESVDMVLTSPPFPQIFSYSGDTEDLGNSENLKGDAWLHFQFFYRALRRVVKPGRVVLVHVVQIPRMKRTGGVGLFDFRGLNIRLAERAGLVYEYDWLARRNPQAQALRNKTRELAFAGLRADRAKSRGALCDYLIKFRAPGENKVPITGDKITNDEWIKWAEGAWFDIKETYTLNVKEARDKSDTRHICPFALDLLTRSIRLFSNPGEIICDPFMGIGSVGFEAIKLGRRFYGCELKKKYYQTALKNLARATGAGRPGFFNGTKNRLRERKMLVD